MMEIRDAVQSDAAGIRALLKANHISTIRPEDKPDGFVTTNLTEEQLTALVETPHGVTVAADGDRILAFALANDWSFWKQWPFFVHMIDILPQYSFDGRQLTVENSYQYGPVCVEKSVRGTGVFQKIFFHSLQAWQDRYPYMVTFINQVNGRSFAVHTRKAGMQECGTFDFNDNHYYLMAISTKAEQPR